MLKFLVLLQCITVFGYRHSCDNKSILQYVHVPTYDFSVRLLDRVAQETDGHFVFSPISTWLQLLTLADGAKGDTFREIIKTTRYYSFKCFRKLAKEIFNNLDYELQIMMKRRSVIVIDKFLDVKRTFVKIVEKLNAAKVLSEDFNTVAESVAKVNDNINIGTNGTITEILDSYDFIRSVLLTADATCMKANWMNPFNPAYTKREIFYSYQKISMGYVNMMNQIGYYKATYIPSIGAQSIEFPFNDRLTMLLFLPKIGSAADLFWSMRKTRLTTILKLLNSNRPKLIHLKLPRFKQTTEVDNMPELLYDMGVQKLFNPRYADLSKISNYRVYVSMMVNKVDIEVTELGVQGIVGPDLLIAREKPINMFFNQPFPYIIADKITNVILFAGIYSEPSLY